MRYYGNEYCSSSRPAHLNFSSPQEVPLDSWSPQLEKNFLLEIFNPIQEIASYQKNLQVVMMVSKVIKWPKAKHKIKTALAS